ncbi:MAG: DUF5060 domain-containing protein [Bacteroidota bacterium]
MKPSFTKKCWLCILGAWITVTAVQAQQVPEGLTATITGSASVQLNWNPDGSGETDHYRVYGSTESDFICNETTLIDSTGALSFEQSGLLTNRTFYFRITAVGLLGEESAPGTAASATLGAQSSFIPGLVFDFNDGATPAWTPNDATYAVSNEDNTFRVDYHRTEASYEWTQMQHMLSTPVDPAGDPRVRLKYKSDTEITLGVKVIYANGGDDWLQKNISGDNAWHELSFDLTKYSGTTVTVLYIYFDGGSQQEKSGIVFFDDIILGSETFELAITGLNAQVTHSNRVDLSWDISFPDHTRKCRIYRGSEKDFLPGPGNLVAMAERTSFSDLGLPLDSTLYYRVSAVNMQDEESVPAGPVKARTYTSTGELSVDMESVNSTSTGLYERFEIDVILVDACYDNPYDPDEIDLSAVFTSPTGKQWYINGYFDNTTLEAQWKVRFSPDETGEWSYVLNAKDSITTASSPRHTFTAVTSGHNGWIRVSEAQPHYFEHHNGETFFGVGAYYPWPGADAEEMFDKLGQAGGNFWGFWNTVIDNATVIESLASGLGRYDQEQCGWIDQLLQYSEERDMKMMLAIWPHNLLDEAVCDICHEWQYNPYKNIMNPAEFFTHEEGWKYQEKQYRYLIARYASYRSLGIWEIINEVTLTDAWMIPNGPANGLEWVRKVDSYFKEHDPYLHPTTANGHGGHYWKEGFGVVDASTVHLYETGWPKRYYGNNMRSSLYVYADISQQMWNDYTQPGFMGEAGFYHTYGDVPAPSKEYTELYHNAMWTCWANGNANAPLWWEFNTLDIMSSDVLEQMKAFSEVVSLVDYSHLNIGPVSADAEGCDAFALAGDTAGFGWLREISGGDIRGKSISLSVVSDTVYSIRWYNTWTGDFLETNYARSVNGTLRFYVPSEAVAPPSADMAFLLNAADPDDYVSVEPSLGITPDIYLGQNVPNPVHTATRIPYALSQSAHVSIKIYDIAGKEVATLLQDYRQAGDHVIEFNAAGLNGGIYFYTLEVRGINRTRKMTIVK